MKPYYCDGAVTIYHGDCLDVMPSIANVDLVFTSPPYNLGVSTGGGLTHYSDDAALGKRGGSGKWKHAALANGYEDHDDAMPPADYDTWQRECLSACWSTLAPAGAIFYNHKTRVQAGALWTPLDVNPGLPVRQIIIWARSGGINFAPTHYVPTHEWIVILAKPAWRLKSKGASGVGDVWRVTQESNNDHPAPFPLTLPATAIETTGPSLVLDPFMGSGTTLRAAKDAGVPAVGIEKSERYCELAALRLSQEVLDFGGAA